MISVRGCAINCKPQIRRRPFCLSKLAAFRQSAKLKQSASHHTFIGLKDMVHAHSRTSLSPAALTISVLQVGDDDHALQVHLVMELLCRCVLLDTDRSQRWDEHRHGVPAKKQEMLEWMEQHALSAEWCTLASTEEELARSLCGCGSCPMLAQVPRFFFWRTVRFHSSMARGHLDSIQIAI